ncbi:MAG: hypothetical protein WD801_05825 [Gemmatimonadaceae bacterium]
MVKAFYLKGAYDGTMFGRGQIDSLPLNISWQTAIDGLDRFYADPANRQVLAFSALQILNMQLTGKPQDQIDAAVRRNRCRGTVAREAAFAGAADAERRVQQCLSGR